MRTGGSIPPYRIPCGGTTTPAFWLGVPYQHGANPATAPINLPTVNVGPGPGCGAINGLYPPCEQFSDDTGGGCSARSGIGPYGNWLGGGPYQYSLAGGQVNTAPDSWASANATENFAACRKAGFKMITARRFWHGLRGFLDYDGTQCPDTTLTCPDTSQISYRGYQPAPSQIKYLTITRQLTYNWTVGFLGFPPGTLNGSGDLCCGGGGVQQTSFFSTGSMSLSVTYSVNPLSGVITQTSQSIAFKPTQGEDFGASVSLSEGTALLFTTGCAANLQAILDTNAASVAAAIPGGATASSSGTLANTSFTASVSIYQPYTLGGSSGCPAEDGMVGSDYELKITLADEYDASNVYTDITTNLLSAWPLNDDQLHPWRTDGCLGAGPLVTRNEKGGNTSPDYQFLGTVDDLRHPVADANGNQPFTSIGITDINGNNPGDPGYIPTVPPGWTYSASNNGPAVTDGVNLPHTTGTYPPGTGLIYNPLQGPSCRPAQDWVPTYGPNRVSWNPTYAPMTWFDSSAYAWRFKQYNGDGGAAYSGSGSQWASDLILLLDSTILGAPKPAGYQNFFCWQCVDWKACSSDGVLEYYTYGYGQTAGAYAAATGAQIPLNATQWTDNYFGIGTPPGASLMYADPTIISVDCGDSAGETLANTGGGLIACKYAEIMENWPSQNFARPGGDDKFLYDETQVCCVSNLTGSGPGATFTSTDPGGNPITLAPAAGSLWGGASVNGFYTLQITGSTVTLGTQVYNLPANWASPSGDNATCFGPLRFPSAPALLGRAALTTSGLTATFALAQPAFGMNTAAGAETIDLYDVNMNLLATAVTATRTGDTTFTTAVAWPAAVWAMITGAPAYQYSDNYRKGDYLALQWTYDRRTNGEYARLQNVTLCDGTSHPAGPAAAWPPGGPFTQANSGYHNFSQTPGCLPFKTCCPAVISFSPNGETWTNGVTYAFPASFLLDELYGSRWQGYVQTTMTDLFWQPPHPPCGFTGTFSMDDGTCQASISTTRYYPYAPQVEARVSVPAGFPALPAGLQIGWLDPTLYATGPNLFNPAAYLYVGYHCDGTPASASTNWTLRANLCANLNCANLPGGNYAATNPPC